MPVEVANPLIARMSIARPLPLHESSRRLRELSPESPTFYGVAVGPHPARPAGRRVLRGCSPRRGHRRAAQRGGADDVGVRHALPMLIERHYRTAGPPRSPEGC